MAEQQYRRQIEIEQDAHIDKIMLRTKEIQDQISRDEESRKVEERLRMKDLI